ncbi:MAG: DUF4352 domain-containing protein [Eubacteriales bacterium]
MAKLIKCKTCGEEIAKKAKVCPKCGAKNKKKGFLLYVLIGIAVIVVIGALSDGDNSDISADSEQIEYAVGDTLTTPRFEITILTVEKRNSVGSEFFQAKASEGGVFVAIQYKYKNVSDKPIGMFSKPDFYLIDPQGNSYDADVSGSSSYTTELDLDENVVSDLNPGIAVKGADVFEVAEELLEQGQWQIKVDADKEFFVNF